MTLSDVLRLVMSAGRAFSTNDVDLKLSPFVSELMEPGFALRFNGSDNPLVALGIPE